MSLSSVCGLLVIIELYNIVTYLIHNFAEIALIV